MYIYVWIVPGCSVHIYHSAWTRLYVAYPHIGAMLEPDCKDRRGMKLVSTSFFVPVCQAAVSIIKNVNRVTVSRGALTGGIVCAFPSEIETNIVHIK